jgi:hypothetical protein
MEWRVARPRQYGEMPAAVALCVGWGAIVAQQGWHVGMKYSWLLLLGIPLGYWTLFMRLRYRPDRLEMTVGPWRRGVDLTALQSIQWRMTGAWRSRGTIFVRDHDGGQTPIYVGRFKRVEEWGPLLLNAAQQTGATVDPESLDLLGGRYD